MSAFTINPKSKLILCNVSNIPKIGNLLDTEYAINCPNLMDHEYLLSYSQKPGPGTGPQRIIQITPRCV